MTRSRKLTLSVKEFSHLVSEALDVANNYPPSQTFVDHTTLISEASQKHRSQPSSSLQRIFARPTPTPCQIEDSVDEPPEDRFETPRKMIPWPFSRSPRKNRPSKDEAVTLEAHDPASPYPITSPAATSTSSLGSLIPADERLFQIVSHDSDEPNQRCDLFAPSSAAAIPPSICEPPTDSGHYADAASLHAIFGNGTAASSNRSTVEPTLASQDQARPSFEGTAGSLSVADNSSDDPTPRAASFGSHAALFPTETRDDPLLARRRRPQRLSVIVPSQNTDVLALRPAVGVAPHVPSETESSTSGCTSSPTSPVAQDASHTSPPRPSTPGSSSPRVPPSTPPNLLCSAFPPSNIESARKRALSRSLTPPPLPRPPPTGPLPAIPSVPPVPPLPPLLHKLSTNMASHSTLPSPPRSAMAGAPTNPAMALPPPPGGLRLPSRLSWVNGVRAVLPSPPASPTKSIRSLCGKPPHPSPPKPIQKRPGELKRPISIGVIEAADNAHVRRTKSILLLGSRSKSNTSLGTKRVQIHADVHLDPTPTSRKPRRKSSAATVGHPIFSSEVHARPIVSPMTSAELLVSRERRHSAPMLTTAGRVLPGVSEDWTLSLPFCTDVPGNTFLPSPSTTPVGTPKEFEVDNEDWTLCMPLKVRVGTPTTMTGTESECTTVGSETTQEVPVQTLTVTQTATVAVQLPTPSPSPTCSTPCSVVCVLPEARVSVEVSERPVSPASLGPHVGGLDLAGRGKRASGWHIYGWFDEVHVPSDEAAPCAANMSEERLDMAEREDVASPMDASDAYKKFFKHPVTTLRRTQGHPSQDSTSSVSTVFYSARSSMIS